MKNIALLLFSVFIVVHVKAETSAEFNQRMNRLYHSAGTKRTSPPSGVKDGFSRLSNAGIPVFKRILQQAKSDQHKHVIIQEWLRKLPDGMPWLPISWRSTSGNTYAYYHSEEVSMSLERTLRSLGQDDDDDMLISYLLGTTVYHSSQKDLVHLFRKAAIRVVNHDSSFVDLRHEVHDAPSWTVVERVKEYIQRAPNPEAKREAELTVKYLEAALGNASVDEFLKIYVPNIQTRDLMLKAANLSKQFQQSNLRLTETVFDEAIGVMEGISQEALSYFNQLRGGSHSCDFDKSINCRYEYIDLLKQVQRITFNLGSTLQEKTMQDDMKWSVRDLFRLVRAYVTTLHTIGLIPAGAYQRISSGMSTSQSNLTAQEVMVALSSVEQEVMESSQRLRRIFSSTMGVYRPFSDKVDLFVDDTLRMNSVLPLAELMSTFNSYLLKISGREFYVNGKGHLMAYRILNPGIAKGRLVIPTEQELKDKNYRWDPNAVYCFVKTPATMQKVAGVLTTDSGSMISHVQLLASNHGIPNVHFSKSDLSTIEQFRGKEVLLISLPNGQAGIKEMSRMTKTEKDVYHQYNRVRQKQKVAISSPRRLDIAYPLKLEQLHMEDRGQVAGGKAVGQGLLSRLFPGRVPKAVVLPFGVYYEHLKDSGVYDRIKGLFQDPALRGNDPDTIDRRREILKNIRQEVMAIELKPSVLGELARFMGDRHYYNHGVFVRSDTNAEDLPGFVGAGLNKTVPNVIGLNAIVDSIKKVWASPFSEKAFTWREDLISNPWDIFPSVIIQRAIPSEKAGVMIVGDPMEEDVDDMVYLAANEGLGLTTVGGEYSAEEVTYMRKSKSIDRLRRAYADKRYKLNAAGGIDKIPVKGYTPILSDKNVKELAEIGDQAQKALAQMGHEGKWDLEWGIVNDEVKLFQIRPFIGNKFMKDVSMLKRLEKPMDDKEVTFNPQSRLIPFERP